MSNNPNAISLLKKYQNIFTSNHCNSNYFEKLHSELIHFYYQYSELNRKEQFIDIIRKSEAFKFFLEEPITYHSYNRPRGYAGDAELIDYLYRLKSPKPSTSHMGKELFAEILNSSICHSVRWRALNLSNKINDFFYDKKKLINILALASGHLRELNYIKDFESKIEKFYAIDQDQESNSEAIRSLPYKNLIITKDSIMSIIKGKYKPPLLLDFIYSAGLFDYLNDKVATRLISICFGFLKPGGKLLIANFAPGIIEQAYMEAFMDWHLIYRDEIQMTKLTSEILNENISKIDMYRDPKGNVVYMEIIRT